MEEIFKARFLDKFRAKYVDFKNIIQFNLNNVHVTQYLKSFVNVFQQAGDLMKIKFSKHGSNKVEMLTCSKLNFVYQSITFL